MPMATPNSTLFVWLAGCLGVLAGVAETLAAPAEAGFVAYATRSYQQAKASYEGAAGDASAGWQFGRACFDLAEFATNSTERASLAEQGMAACRMALARQSNSALAHYYLGMNMGQLARTRGLSALKLVDQMEQEFLRARDLDEHCNYAGPDRSLGLLYKDAPSIASVGSRSRAKKHLRRAAEVAPQYPENELNLAEAYLGWGDRNEASRQLKATEATWVAARTNFVGEAWAACWADWETRLKKLQKKLSEPAKTLVAPRDKQ
jgi:hypothetical protein